MFPSSAEDGSIEALPAAIGPPAADRWFPSSAEDGSIEARSSLSLAVPLRLCFRPQLRTAPLKRAECWCSQALVPMFPSSAEDGSIEAPVGNRAFVSMFLFPSSAEDGSIEADRDAHTSCPDKSPFPSSAEDGSIEAAGTCERIRLVLKVSVLS